MNLDKEWSESFDIMDAIPELTHAISDNVEVWTPNLNECKKNTYVSV